MTARIQLCGVGSFNSPHDIAARTSELHKGEKVILNIQNKSYLCLFGDVFRRIIDPSVFG